jgi:hypothetical protein
MVEDEITIIRNEMAFHHNLGTYEWDSWLCYYKDENFCGVLTAQIKCKFSIPRIEKLFSQIIKICSYQVVISTSHLAYFRMLWLD